MGAKSLFITPFITASAIAALVAVSQIVGGDAWLPWVGVLLVTAPIPLMIGYWVLTSRTSRTQRTLPGLIAAAVVGVVLALAAQLGVVGSPAPLATVLALLGLGGVLTYVYWYSVFDRAKSQALRVGQPLPSFVLHDADGNDVHSDNFVGAPTVLMFFRGNWCPLCMAQIKEIAALYRELDERGAKVRLVSPQSHDNTRALAKRFDVPFDFLVDPQSRVAKSLEILSPDGIPLGLTLQGYDQDVPMPTVVITDAQGVILFCDETDNYRVRPEPETFLKVLDGQRLTA